MDLFSELVDAVQDDLTIGDESTLFPLALVKRAVNRGKRKAEGLFRWSQLKDAKETSTGANQEYYNYPSTWEPDSIWKITVDDTDLGDPLVFKDYLEEKENDFPSGNRSIWGTEGTQFFLQIEGAAPATTGEFNISLWGKKVTPALSADSDTTIFSYSMPDCNEAIVLEASAILKNKGKEMSDGQFASLEAKQILVNAWGKIQKNQAKFEKSQPMFDVPDFFGKAKTPTGGF